MNKKQRWPACFLIIWLAGCSTVAATGTDSETAGQLDFLAGDWILYDTDGQRVGVSRIVAQVPGTMLYEVRTLDGKQPQSLWLENAERNGGWTQLFVGPAGQTRQFPLQSAPGEWPLVMGADVVLRSGQSVAFRMTISKESDDTSRRVLEMTANQGESWRTIFDYNYRRQ
ncbi:MAG: hypothetical protein HKN49_03195 [Gammaproteobacteria bacterium]|nr:hypothetical protein [Gammaproteobacteria bacterium]